MIKSHHNVGGLPEDMDFELVEPLRALFKDEVRRVGEELGLPEEIVWRQPFPGPGLGVRIIGEVTPEKVAILQRADAIVREEIKKAGLEREVWQAFAVLPDIRSVGVMGDERTYAYPIIIRAVTSEDAMTADWARLPYELLETLSRRIINEVRGSTAWRTTSPRSRRAPSNGSSHDPVDVDLPPGLDRSSRADADWLLDLLLEATAGPQMVSRGRLHDGLSLDGLVAEHEGAPAGALLWEIRDGELEVVFIGATVDGVGAGTAAAARGGASRLPMTSTAGVPSWSPPTTTRLGNPLLPAAGLGAGRRPHRRAAR